MDVTNSIIAAAVVISASTLVKDAVEKKQFHFAPIIFGFLLASALLLMAFFAPGVARALAIMGLVGALVVNGPAVFKLAGVVGGQTPKAAKK